MPRDAVSRTANVGTVGKKEEIKKKLSQRLHSFQFGSKREYISRKTHTNAYTMYMHLCVFLYYVCFVCILYIQNTHSTEIHTLSDTHTHTTHTQHRHTHTHTHAHTTHINFLLFVEILLSVFLLTLFNLLNINICY